jgi:hypothetical protein
VGAVWAWLPRGQWTFIAYAPDVATAQEVAASLNRLGVFDRGRVVFYWARAAGSWSGGDWGGSWYRIQRQTGAGFDRQMTTIAQAFGTDAAHQVISALRRDGWGKHFDLIAQGAPTMPRVA